MKSVSSFCIRVSLVLASFAASPASADSFNNDSVIALAKAGVGDGVLLAKISSLPCGYEVSTEKIIALKAAGVSNTVIAAMVERCTGASRAQGTVAADGDPSVKRTPGLYIDLGQQPVHRLQVIRPTMASGARVSGNGSLLFPRVARLSIPRQSAQIVATNRQPTFYFYFETDDHKVGDFGTSGTVSAQSPSEFSLVRFRVKNGQREMSIGKATMFKSTVGVESKEAIQFSITEIGDGIFSAHVETVLTPGEYGFVLRAGSDAYRIYDFRLDS